MLASHKSLFRPPSLLERIIYYMYAPEIFSRVVLELGLGIYWYTITQPKQWVFYLLMSVEYLYQITHIRSGRFVVSWRTAPTLLALCMLVHGIVIGLAASNSPAKVASDSIPVLVIAINTYLFARTDAFSDFNIARLSRINIAYGLVMVLTGMIAVRLGRPSIVSLGSLVGTSICITIILVTLNKKPRLHWTEIVLSLFVVGMIAPNMNRTSLIVVFLGFALFVLPRMMRSSLNAYAGMIAILLAAIAVPIVLPEDSPIIRRINGLFAYDPNATTGSIGERQAETIAVNEKLDRLGVEHQIFGLGAGGTYDVVFSDGRIPENYSHAHFGWTLFKLRYGFVGYIYLSLFALCLLYALYRNFSDRSAVGLLLGILGLWGGFSIFTYMYYNQLAAGLQLIYREKIQR